MKTQKRFMENMQLMFQKLQLLQRQRLSPLDLIGHGRMKKTIDVSEQESYDRDIHEKIPSASRKTCEAG